MKDYSHIRVLVVDNEPATRASLSAFLENYGFHAASCSSAEEARDLMRDRPFKVCIVELDLPGLSGEDLILLGSRHFPDQQYIIHTGDKSYLLPERLEKLGMRRESVFLKPISAPNVLVRRIKELVQVRGESVSQPNQ